jgi:hypothetical protein
MEQEPETMHELHTPPEDEVNPVQQEIEGAEALEARQYKTLAVRLDHDLHARLSFIAQLRGTSLSAEMLEGVRDRVTAAQDDPELIARAAEARAQIERDAKARQDAIASMFGTAAVAETVEVAEAPKASRRAGRGSGAEPKSS